MKDKLYRRIACALVAYENCLGRGAMEWAGKHKAYIEKLIYDYMPSGSGFDDGTKLDYGKSSAEKLVFTALYHAMNEAGYYTHYSTYTIAVKSSLCHGHEVFVRGPRDGDTRDYVCDTFHTALGAEVE